MWASSEEEGVFETWGSAKLSPKATFLAVEKKAIKLFRRAQALKDQKYIRPNVSDGSVKKKKAFLKPGDLLSCPKATFQAVQKKSNQAIQGKLGDLLA
ncbi:hypothetical protein CDAR_622321 [Caerostris darwini]|uniref:Uncharacterized protein n=1 Tax=Caerostris darwini TaxID=1538125 RepID=A0AAV4W0Y3_9ARAC|nr:hypothetical protein CDAR_622321 [Caerostris darwini]